MGVPIIDPDLCVRVCVCVCGGVYLGACACTHVNTQAHTATKSNLFV